ncbi:MULTISPECIES: hypothetical protein [Chitinophaga]|uniref:hypothetical protein n=1 Tax=Chitinophaga TaxID=79328 RepID=UPI0013565D8D|nr:hypothetical protein [Chitinophaga ginsengisegetis]MDR6567739.1 hypothetical protein [Chitinophaga ginsengisegetis]MDR6647706.1 hypothetical protein [Chitinophaga ginsengisegetis]MDR6654056.1 hypothetical protein [Chitinophaga ginsengisegetis]
MYQLLEPTPELLYTPGIPVDFRQNIFSEKIWCNGQRDLCRHFIYTNRRDEQRRYQ